MATEDKQRILDWCSADSDVRCVEGEGEPGADFTLCLESGGAELTATLPIGGDRLVLRGVVDLAEAAHPSGNGDLAADLVDLEERRPGPVTASLDPSGEQVVISTWIVLDGLTKHSFLTAVSDLHRTWGAVVRLTGVTTEAAATEVLGVAGGETEMPVAAMPGASAEAASAEGDAPEGVAGAASTPWAWSPAGASAAFAAVGGGGAPDDSSTPSDSAATDETPVPVDTVSPEDAAGSDYASTADDAAAPEGDPAHMAETASAAVAEAEDDGAAVYAEPAYPEGQALVETDVAPEAEAAPEVVGAAETETDAAPEAEATPEAGATPEPSPWAWSPAASASTAFATANASPEASEPEQEEQPVAEASPTSAEEQAPATVPWGDAAETTFEPLVSPYHPLDSPGQSYPESAAPIAFEATPGPLAQAASAAASGSGQSYGAPFTPGEAVTPVPAPAPEPLAWAPGHKVPPQGMQAWAAPDPAGAVIATLGGHLPVQVTEVRGAWAHVLCSNGWAGWVDDRLLVVGA